MNATTPLLALAAVLTATLACTPVQADTADACEVVVWTNGVPGPDPDCLPSDSQSSVTGSGGDAEGVLAP